MSVAGRVALAAWSGGKDGCLAAFSAASAGWRLAGLVNVVSARTGRVAFQDIPSSLVWAQSAAVRVPIIRVAVDRPEDPERCLAAALARLGKAAKALGASALVSGHIGTRDRQGAQMEDLCARLGLRLVAPLAGASSVDVFDRFRSAGFKAVVAKVDGRALGADWLGRPVDDGLRRTLAPVPGADVCGDHGEYHSFVVDGPNFSHPIAVRAAGAVRCGAGAGFRVARWSIERSKRR